MSLPVWERWCSLPSRRNQTSEVPRGACQQESQPVVFKDAFYFVLVSPPGGSGGGSGLSLSAGNRRFWVDSGPDPGVIFLRYFYSSLKRSWEEVTKPRKCRPELANANETGDCSTHGDDEKRTNLHIQTNGHTL